MATNDTICFPWWLNLLQWWVALNSLSSNGLVCLLTKQHEQFEVLIEDYFNSSDASDYASSSGSDDEME